MDDFLGETDDGELPLTRRSKTQRRWRFALAAVTALLALVVIVNVWRPLNEPGMRTGAVSPYATETAQPSPTPVLTPTPLPIVGALGLPPTNCPTLASLDTMTVSDLDGSTTLVQLFGRRPVWVPYLAPGFVISIYQPTPSPSSSSWPSTQLMWVLGPDVHPVVTVRATDLRTGGAVWWSIGPSSSPLVPLLTLNSNLNPSAPTEKWMVFVTEMYILHADCYELDVSWSGGAWQAIFAAGRATT